MLLAGNAFSQTALTISAVQQGILETWRSACGARVEARQTAAPPCPARPCHLFQEEIAGLIGASRETVRSRHRPEPNAQEWLTNGRMLSVLASTPTLPGTRGGGWVSAVATSACECAIVKCHECVLKWSRHQSTGIGRQPNGDRIPAATEVGGPDGAGGNRTDGWRARRLADL